MVHSHMKRHIQSPPDTFQTPYRHPTDTLQTPSRLRLNVCVNSIKCLSHFGRIVSVYGLTCPFAYSHWRAIVWTKNSFKFFLHWEGGKSLFQKKKKYEGKHEGAHIWATVQSRRKTHLHHRGLLLRPVSWSSVGTYILFPIRITFQLIKYHIQRIMRVIKKVK